MTRTIHDMAYDPVRDEIVVPQFFAFAILTFRGNATGDAAPVRKIFGPSTQLVNPDALAVDPIHGEIFVPQGNQPPPPKILVFPRDADGNVAPIRILEGPDTGMVDANRITVDPVNDLLIVTGGGKLLIYDRTASGNAKPRSVISVPGGRLMTTYPPRGLIFVAVVGRSNGPQNFVGVWSIQDKGDAPPRWTIGGPNGILRDVRGVAVDPKHQNVIISDKYINGVLTFHLPEAF